MSPNNRPKRFLVVEDQIVYLRVVSGLLKRH